MLKKKVIQMSSMTKNLIVKLRVTQQFIAKMKV